MKYDTLKLDTESNTICCMWPCFFERNPFHSLFLVREDWRESLESDQWMLFPSIDIIDRLWQRWIGPGMNSENLPFIEDVRATLLWPVRTLTGL